MTLSIALDSGYSSAKSIFELIGLLVVCILVFAASYYVTKFVGKKQKGNLERGNFRNIDIYRMSPNKYLQIIQVGKKYALISVTKEEVRLVMELTEEDILKWPEEVQKTTFKDIFANIKNKGQLSGDKAGESSAKISSADMSSEVSDEMEEFEKLPLNQKFNDKAD